MAARSSSFMLQPSSSSRTQDHNYPPFQQIHTAASLQPITACHTLALPSPSDACICAVPFSVSCK